MNTLRPKVSVVIPIHDMRNGDFFLWRLINSLLAQTFTDYEIIITRKGKMAENTNAGIYKACGELVKIMYMDDYFAHENALQTIVDNFGPYDHWLVTGCLHARSNEQPHSPHLPQPEYDDLVRGINGIGSPSVLTIRRDTANFFDEKLSWVLDCDLYARYYEMCGKPKIIEDLNVIVGLHDGQMTHILTNEEKQKEVEYLKNKMNV